MIDLKKNKNEKLVERYFNLLDEHIENVISGKVLDFMHIRKIASRLSVSHKYLSEVVKKETGRFPCYFYDQKIIKKAKIMLTEDDKPISEIAKIFTYDPSNFSKFFKKMTGETPGNFRTKN